MQIFGDPRSGSTWLAELLSQLPKYCLVDEPLNLNYNDHLRKMDFGWRQYIPKQENWAEANDFFQKLYRGENIPPGCIASNGLMHFINSDKGVFKIIRGKLLLEWLLYHFEFKYKPIFLIRHPLAVINSIKKHKSWSYKFKPFEISKSPFQERYKMHESFLKDLKNTREQILAHWCIANLSYFQGVSFMDQTIVVKYEDLVLEPRTILEQLLREWNYVPSDFKFKNVAAPSATSEVNVKSIDPKNQIEKWKTQLDPLEINRYQEILNYFHIEY